MSKEYLNKAIDAVFSRDAAKFKDSIDSHLIQAANEAIDSIKTEIAADLGQVEETAGDEPASEDSEDDGSDPIQENRRLHDMPRAGVGIYANSARNAKTTLKKKFGFKPKELKGSKQKKDFEPKYQHDESAKTDNLLKWSKGHKDKDKADSKKKIDDLLKWSKSHKSSEKKDVSEAEKPYNPNWRSAESKQKKYQRAIAVDKVRDARAKEAEDKQKERRRGRPYSGTSDRNIDD